MREQEKKRKGRRKGVRNLFTLNIEIDATDRLDQANLRVATRGTCPTLAAPFSKGWPLFKNSRTTKTNIHREEAFMSRQIDRREFSQRRTTKA